MRKHSLSKALYYEPPGYSICETISTYRFSGKPRSKLFTKHGDDHWDFNYSTMYLLLYR